MPAFAVRFACGVALAALVFALPACGKRAEVEQAEVQPPPPPVPPQPPPTPKLPKQPRAKQPAGGKTGGFGIDPLGGLLGNKPADAKTETALREKYASELVGVWTADLGNGATEEVVYTKNGTFTGKLTGPNPAAEALSYEVVGLVGTKGLKIEHRKTDGTRVRTITAMFAGDELEHPSLQKGVVGTFRRK